MADRHFHIETDDAGRIVECPRCGNRKFSANAQYCRMCGLYLYNECVNQESSEREYCGKRNPGDARYCEHCGAETLFLRQGLLATWEEIAARGDQAGLRQPARGATPLRVAVGAGERST